MPLLGYIPNEAIHGMYVCALRFDGCRYEEEILNDSCGLGLLKITQPIQESLLFDRDPAVNFAAFYTTQRRLKEDDMLKDSRDHILFDMLFLHLYKAEVPARFRNEEFCCKWEAEHREQAEIMAAMIRDSFASVPRIVPKVY